jgi:peroxiredoxin
MRFVAGWKPVAQACGVARAGDNDLADGLAGEYWMHRSQLSLVLLIAGFLLPLSAQAQDNAAVTGAPAAMQFDSVDDLQRHFIKRLEASQRAIEEERLAALERLLESTSAVEHRIVLLLTINAATALERFEKVISLSEVFLRLYGDTNDVWEARGRRLAALIGLGRLEEARREWEDLPQVTREGSWGQVFESGMLIADGFADAGRPADVKTMYELLRERLRFVPGLESVLGPSTDDLYWYGREAPMLEGKDLDGEAVDLSEYAGKVVLIDFWATNCAPCITGLPDLIRTYEELHERGFEILGISLDAQVATVEQFLQRRKLPWRQICDGQSFSGPNARKYDVSRLPSTFLLDRRGRIARVGVPARGFGPVVQRLLEEVSEVPR